MGDQSDTEVLGTQRQFDSLERRKLKVVWLESALRSVFTGIQ